MAATEATGGGVRWSLDGLFASAEDARTDSEGALADAKNFAERWNGRLADLDSAMLAEALAELGDLRAARQEAESYHYLAESTDSENAEIRDLGAWLEPRLTEIANVIRAFELEWIGLPAGTADRLLASPEVAHEAHALDKLRRSVPYTLSEPEERLLNERDATALKAWQTLFNRHLSTLAADFDSGTGLEPHAISQLTSLLGHPERDVRGRANLALRELVVPAQPVLAQCYDTIVADRLLLDRLQGYPEPMLRAHLENELEAGVVLTMLDAVEAAYPLAQRWFRVKARCLGLPVLAFSDIRAPVGDSQPILWPEAVELATAAFARVSPELAGLAGAFFEERRVDAEPRRGKYGGAFCVAASVRTPAYLLVNHADQLTDVLTLAHELGHGTHYTVSQIQSQSSWESGLALLEVPSTFAELLLVDHLTASGVSDEVSLALNATVLDEVIGAVYRQTVFVRYEQRAYALREEGIVLTPERLGEIMSEEFAKLNGDAVVAELDDPSWTWARIPHFIDTRFYTYAYVFAFLVAFTTQARMRELPDFSERYLRFLAYGGSASPAAQLAELGIDLADPGIWSAAFSEIERRVQVLEALTAA
ncbi:MAG: M3 family metallopeptidase [Actinomycetota bacterium]